MTDSHYFDAKPTVASQRRSIDVALPDMSFTLTTDTGVFGRDRLDTGTKLMLIEAPSPPATGNLLDLGCGAGAVAVTLARRSPQATVWAVDVNERALRLTLDNCREAGCHNVRVSVPDDVPADVRFDVIWSNPPIRIGKPALHDLLRRWLGLLTRDGTALLVVQQHLGADSLATWLGGQGWTVRRLRSRAGYRLLQVARPPTQTL
jgi:16S rRNA (guanine1207-N2)-methyltransferase